MSQANPDPDLARGGGEPRSPFAAALRFIANHPMGVAQALGVLLAVIIVLQNVEPTSIDLLFWSVARVPKLVLILVAMVAGGLTWEVLRRRLLG